MSKSTVDKGPSHPGCHVSNAYGLGEHCFRGRWVLAHWFVLSCIHSLRVSPLHVCSMDYFPVHIKGRSGLGFQRNLELAFSNLSVSAMP